MVRPGVWRDPANPGHLVRRILSTGLAFLPVLLCSCSTPPEPRVIASRVFDSSVLSAMVTTYPAEPAESLVVRSATVYANGWRTETPVYCEPTRVENLAASALRFDAPVESPPSLRDAARSTWQATALPNGEVRGSRGLPVVLPADGPGFLPGLWPVRIRLVVDYDRKRYEVIVPFRLEQRVIAGEVGRQWRWVTGSETVRPVGEMKTPQGKR